MGTQERKAQSVITTWWRYLGEETKQKERREWINQLKLWQKVVVFMMTIIVALLLVMLLPFAWLYEKTR
tara:strand:- start:4240 stop:4446 length:207 start_codon:yes stop_codon:yes gene_type:complete